MAKRAKKKSKKTATSRALHGPALSKKLGHKPVHVLVDFRNTMKENIIKLDNLIERREAAGE
jgi:hypothetical protein